MCCSSIACLDCLCRWKNSSDTCPHCRASSPVPIPMQIKGGEAILRMLRSLKNENVQPDESFRLPDLN